MVVSCYQSFVFFFRVGVFLSLVEAVSCGVRETNSDAIVYNPSLELIIDLQIETGAFFQVFQDSHSLLEELFVLLFYDASLAAVSKARTF